MGRYVARRGAQMVPVLLLSALGIFLWLRLLPGDPAVIFSGPDAAPEQIQAARHILGLDRPLPVQFLLWGGQLLSGQLGVSYSSRAPTARLIGQVLPATLELTAAGMLITVLISLPLGILAALRRGKTLDAVLTGAMSVALGIPPFWTGILLIIVFSVALGWLPPSGSAPLLAAPGPALRFLVMPAVTLALFLVPQMALFTRTAMIEVLQEQYMRTALAKGATPAGIVFKHALRNALIPVVTIMGLQLNRLLGGAVIVESVFAWPGIGSLVLRALGNRDFPVVQGVLVVFVLLTLVINLLTDVTYGFVDPRVAVAAEVARAGRRT